MKKIILRGFIVAFLVVILLALPNLNGLKGDILQPKRPCYIKEYALFGNDNLTISGNTKIYSISSIAYPVEEGNGNIRSNGNITISGSNYINGDVISGPQYNAQITGNNKILGSIYSADSAIDPSISLSSDWLSYAQQNNSNASIPSQFLNSSGKLNISGNKTCILPSGVYYLNGINLSGSANLVLDGNAVFACYGPIEIGGNSKLNYSNNPSKCLIISIDQSGSFSGNGKGSFELFSPLSQISFTGNYEAVCSLWAKSVSLSGSTILKRYTNPQPPQIGIASPENNSFLNTNLPYIRVNYNDTGGDIDRETLEVTIDDVTIENLSVNETYAEGNIFTPLSEGTHTIKAKISSCYSVYGEDEKTFAVDTIPPRIVISSPQEGLLTKIPNQTIAGTVSEQCTLKINGESVSLDGLNFSKEVLLSEGVNEFLISAIDLAGNFISLTLYLTLDTIAPPEIDASKVSISPSASGVVTILGSPSSAEANSTIIAQNTRTGETTSKLAYADGSFSITIGGETNDVIALRSQDSAGNSSPLISLTVPSSGGGDELPKDPSEVAPPNDPTIPTDIAASTKFLYEGDNPIQRDVASGTIDARRVAILRGRVLVVDGEPLSGVKVTILNHPEYGWTLSREDGMFDIAVNGGGYLRISYQKEGYLSVQRQIDTPWRDFIWAPDVVMTKLDPIATPINLSTPLLMQIAQGSEVTDIDGTRKAALLIPTGTTAQMIMPDGSAQPLTTANVRITEYTVGEDGLKAMPAELPPQSGYTYCVELSADEAISAGADKVQFSQPLVYYVNNFIGFPVGTPVPVGYYDRKEGVWKAEDNGIVIKILGFDDGLAVLDIDGAGFPADPVKLSALGITDEERANIAYLYPEVGTSLWRVKIKHFSSWDCNWPAWVPDNSPPPDVDEAKQNFASKTCETGNSIIGIQNQTLGEVFGLSGLPFSIYFQSTRQFDFSALYSLDIPLSKSSIPSTLKSIELEVEVAGQIYKYSYSPQPNLIHSFEWDGRDAYGRMYQGAVPAKVKVGWVYPIVYKQVSAARAVFAAISASGFDITGSRKTSEITFSKIYTKILGTINSASSSIGGWTLDAQNVYDTLSKTVYLSDGSLEKADLSIEGIIDKIVGGGTVPFYEGIPATQANNITCFSAATDPNGAIYTAGQTRYKVYKIAEGKIYTFAGNGTWGDSGDGGLAVNAKFKNPFDVAVGPDGSVYIADSHSYKVRKVTPDGIITTFAGNGSSIVSGDDGLAVSAGLGAPTSVSVASDNSVFICTPGRIRRVTPDGIITTYAGGGTLTGVNAEGAMATKVQLSSTIRRIAVANDATLYIVSENPAKVYSVTPSGIFRTFAGVGTMGHSGDGGPAVYAQLDSPYSIAVDGKNKGIYISERNYVRYVNSSGTITTIAGNGASSSTPLDGVPPLQTQITGVWNLGVDKEGKLLICTSDRIRRIGTTFPGFSSAEIFIPSKDGSEIYHFSKQGRHLQTLNALTGAPIWTFGYDAEGRLISITDAYNSTVTIQRDANGNPTAIISPYGQTTKLTTNINGYLSSIQAPDGSTMVFTYTDGGLLKTFTDSRGQVHNFTYDEKGRLISDADPTGATKSLVMQEVPGGWSVTLTSAEGHSKTYTITDIATGGERRTVVDSGCSSCSTTSEILPDGTTKVTSGDGTISTITEGPDPRWGMMAGIPKSFSVSTPGGKTLSGTMTRAVTLTNPSDVMSLTTQTDNLTINNKTFTTTYTASNKTFVTTTPTGKQVSSQIDSNGKVVSQFISGIDPIGFSYDTRGRTSSLTQGSRSVSLSYDTSGNLSCVTDPLGRSVSFAYDPNGRVTSQTFPDGRIASFAYDANGNVISITPPGKPPHTFTYSAVDLQATYTPPDIGIGPTTTTYSYNGDRQLTRVDRPDSKSIAMSYDGSGRLSTVTTPEGTTSLTYDGATGQLTSIANPDGITNSYTYDGFLPLTEIWTGNVTGSITRTFNNDFQLASVSINGGTAIPYTYDNDGLLTNVDGLTLARNTQNGLLTGSTLGSVTDTYTYNSFGEVSNYTAAYPAGLSYEVSYTRDAIGRITGKTEVTNGITTSWGYSYDLSGRLTQTTKNGELWASYGYDTNGNRLTKTTSTQTITGTYDAQDRLLAYGNYTYTYTANGELETKTNTVTSETTSYEYDVLGNLRSVLLPDGTKIEYIIDGRNRRVGKKVNGMIQRQWIYDGQLRPVAEMDGSGVLTAQFVYATHINVPDYIIKGATIYRVITDHLGSLRFVIDVSTGSIAQRMDYDDWGNVLLNTTPDFTPFGFAGGMYDSQTKLVRFGARDYDAEVGRWTGKDPIGFGGNTGNLFVYIENDPINYIDPEGLARLCFRRFNMKEGTWLYYGLLYPFSFGTGHCYLSYSEDSASSYGPEGVANKDPLSGTYFQLCSPPLTGSECCDKDCLKAEMANYAKGSAYNLISHNCCDASRYAIKECKCKEPLLLKIANYGF